MSVAQSEARLSRVLQTTQWLKSQDDTTVLESLDLWKTAVNRSSVGELVASFFFREAAKLSDDVVDTLLAFSRNNNKSHNNTDSESKKLHLLRKDNDVAAPVPTTIFSTPHDICLELGSFLTRKDGLTFGNCCHELHRLTRTKSFLDKTVDHSVHLSANDFDRIQKLHADPWIQFVNCTHLHLKACNVDKQLSPESCEQIKLLCKNLTSLSIETSESCISKHLPIDALFSLKRLNKQTNEIEVVQKKGLVMTLLRGDDEGSCGTFFEKYKHFCSPAESMQYVRKIDKICFDSKKTLARVSKSLPLLHPNYRELVLSGELKILDKGLNLEFFHSQLKCLKCYRMSLSASTVFELLHLAASQGYLFNINNAAQRHNERMDEDDLKRLDYAPEKLAQMMTSYNNHGPPNRKDYSWAVVKGSGIMGCPVVKLYFRLVRKWLWHLIECGDLNIDIVNQLKRGNVEHLTLFKYQFVDTWFPRYLPFAYKLLNLHKSVRILDVRTDSFMITHGYDTHINKGFLTLVKDIGCTFENLNKVSICIAIQIAEDDISAWCEFFSENAEKWMLATFENINCADVNLGLEISLECKESETERWNVWISGKDKQKDEKACVEWVNQVKAVTNIIKLQEIHM